MQPDPTDIRRDLVTLLPRLRRFALALTGQGHEVDELVREACASAVLKAPHFKGGNRLESRVFGLIREIWTKRSETRKPRPQDSICGSFSDHYAFLDLPEGAAPAFLLVSIEEHSYAQAAEIMNVSQQFIATNVALARRRFSEMSDDASERRA